MTRLSFAVGFVTAVMISSSALAADVPISDEAKKQFKSGISFLEDPDGARYEEAYAAFKAAYAASPSPKILGNLGLCAMKLEREGEAIDAYSRYLKEVSDIPPQEREQISRDLSAMQTSVVRVAITVSPATATIIDTRKPVKGADVSNIYAVSAGSVSLGVRPGRHLLTVRAPGMKDETWEIDAAAASKHERSFELKPPKVASTATATAAPPPPPRKAPPGSYVLMGIGGAMVVGGAVTGFMTLGKVKDLEKLCPDNQCPAGSDFEDKKSSAKTFRTLTDVLLISGGAMVAGGAVWLISSSSGKSSTGAATPRATGGAMCTGNGCLGSVRVAFLRGMIQMKRALLPTLVLASLALSAGCTLAVDVDRFKESTSSATTGPQQVGKNDELVLRLTGMTAHQNQMLEYRVVGSDDNVIYFKGFIKPLGVPTLELRAPGAVPRNSKPFRLDFYADVNNSGNFDGIDSVSSNDHAWRIEPLAKANKDGQVVIEFTHNFDFTDLDQYPKGVNDPAKELFTPAEIKLQNLGSAKIVELRIIDTGSKHTAVLYRFPQAKDGDSMKVKGMIEVGNPYVVDVIVDDATHFCIPDPSVTDPAGLVATFDPSTATPGACAKLGTRDVPRTRSSHRRQVQGGQGPRRRGHGGRLRGGERPHQAAGRDQGAAPRDRSEDRSRHALRA